MSRRSHDTWGAARVLHAPRINPRPLPDIRSPLMTPHTKIPTSQPLATPRPSTTRHQHRGCTDEPGYSSSLEYSAAPRPRPRPTSQVVRTPLEPGPPLRGILKTGEGVDPKSNE
jgi:hypothetical protein